MLTLTTLISLLLFQSASLPASPDALIPIGSQIPKFLQCTRQPTGEIKCLPVTIMPSVVYRQDNTGAVRVSSPDPARSLWVQGLPIITSDYTTDATSTGSLDPMPMNYFCVNSNPAVTGNASGVAALIFDVRLTLPDTITAPSSTIRVSGLISSTGSTPTGPQLLPALSAAVPWPGTYPLPSVSPTGMVHWYPIGLGCRGYPAISFTDNDKVIYSAKETPYSIDDVYVYVSIP